MKKKFTALGIIFSAAFMACGEEEKFYIQQELPEISIFSVPTEHMSDPQWALNEWLQENPGQRIRMFFGISFKNDIIGFIVYHIFGESEQICDKISTTIQTGFNLWDSPELTKKYGSPVHITNFFFLPPLRQDQTKYEVLICYEFI